jgi:hypothetical protein
MRPLSIPPALKDAEDAVEVARVWVGKGDLHVMLSVGGYEAGEGPGESTAWGDIMADTVRHVARAISKSTGTYEHVCLREIVDRMMDSLKNDPRFMEGDFHL